MENLWDGNLEVMEKINSGINFFNKKNLIASISYKVVKVGEESIINRPYEPYKDYLERRFPSGVIRKINYLNFEINWNWKLMFYL